jgi:hypothetical protein
VCQNKDHKLPVALEILSIYIYIYIYIYTYTYIYIYIYIITSALQKNVPGFLGTLLMVLYMDAVLYCDCETVQLNRLIMNSKIVIVIIACVWHVAIL